MNEIHFQQFFDIVADAYREPAVRKCLYMQLREAGLTQDSNSTAFFSLINRIQLYLAKGAGGRHFVFDNRNAELLNSFFDGLGSVKKAIAFHYYFLCHPDSYGAYADALNKQINLKSLMGEAFETATFSGWRIWQPGNPTEQGPWTTALQEAILRSQLTVLPRENVLNIVQTRPRRQRPLQRLRLGEEFQLSWKTGFTGFAASLQRYDGNWYPLTDCAPIKAGRTVIPPSTPLEQMFLVEEDMNEGMHVFVVISSLSPIQFDWGDNSSSSINPLQLDDWYRNLVSSSHADLHACEIFFVA